MNWDKRSIIYFSIFIIMSLALAAGAYFAYKYVFDEEPVLEEGTARENQGQLEELDALRQQANRLPFSQEDIERQEQELDNARQQENPEPLSQEQINQQFEELDNLHSQAQ